VAAVSGQQPPAGRRPGDGRPSAASCRPEQADVVAAVVATQEAFYAAVEAADLDALGRIWVEDDGATCVHPGWDPVLGRAAVLRSWAALLAGTAYLQFVLTDVRVCVAGATAVVSCTENVLTADDATPDDAFAGGRAVAPNVFRRQPGGTWRLWSHHASPVLVRG
jgi:ketosteroid isomerase-like protein